MSLFNQKGVKSFEAGPIEATQTVGTRPNAVPVQMQIPLKGVVPGRYVCQLNVVDQVGRKFLHGIEGLPCLRLWGGASRAFEVVAAKGIHALSVPRAQSGAGASLHKAIALRPSANS